MREDACTRSHESTAETAGPGADLWEGLGDAVGIEGITPALRQVLPGYMFVALGSNSEEAHSRIHQALQRGAVAVLAEWAPENLPEDLPWGTFRYLRVLDATSAWFWLCENWRHLCRLGADSAPGIEP